MRWVIEEREKNGGRRGKGSEGEGRWLNHPIPSLLSRLEMKHLDGWWKERREDIRNEKREREGRNEKVLSSVSSHHLKRKGMNE